MGISGPLCAAAARLALVLLLSTLALLPAARGGAHEVTPVIGNFQIEDGQIRLDLRMNIEAFVAGIDLDGMADTDTSAQAADYDALRALAPSDLEPMARQFAEEWAETLLLSAGAPVALRVADMSIPEAGDVELPRASVLSLDGEIPAAARSLAIAWPKGAGDVVLRQNGVEDPYTGYLRGGETTPPIPLAGGAAKSAAETFAEYIPVGFDHILPKGLDHILFVLGLYFLSARLRALLWQISAFTVAHTITLALGATGTVTVNPAVVEPLIAASIVFVAVENIFSRRLHAWRPLVVFGFGLLHGLGFASVLGDFGLPPNQFVPALLGFNIGVELGQLTVIAIAYGLLGFWFGKHPKYRGRVAIPASITIALIGGYWFAERVFL